MSPNRKEESSAMRMPGLKAEASLYSSKGRYRGATVAHPNVPQVVVSQSEKSDCENNCLIGYGECVDSGWWSELDCFRRYRDCHWDCRLLDPWER
jgi:hypothetical protein